MVLARFLSPEDFGKDGVLALFISIASTLNDAGLSGSLIKEANITNLDCSTINVFNIGVSVILYLVLFFCAPLLESFFSVEGLKGIVRCLCLVFLINSFCTVPKAIMIRNLRFKALSIITFGSVCIASCIAIIAAIYNCGAYSLVYYQLTVASITSISIILLTKYRFSIRFSKVCFRKLFSFGFFTTVTNILDNVYENLLTFLFGKFLNLNQAGYLSQAKKLEDTSISAFKNTIGQVAFPILTRLREDNEIFWTEALSITKNLILLVLPCLLVASIYSSNIIVLAFGEKWISAGPYLAALLVAGFFMLLESTVRTFIKSMGNVAKLAEYTFIKRILCIVLIVSSAMVNPKLIIPTYILGSIIGLYVNITLFCKILKKEQWSYIKDICKFSIPSFVCCSICWMFYEILQIWLSVVFTFIIGMTYLWIILPKYGIDLQNLIRSRR